MSEFSCHRPIDYLRVSVTDRCNLRCRYCMPKEGIATVPPPEVLTFEEIRRLGNIFCGLGVTKIRLTGGEPLVRKNITDLIRLLRSIEGLKETCLTTNGILLSLFAERLKEAGLGRLNISLDTLNAGTFRNITGYDALEAVLEGIGEARRAGFSDIKLNVVVLKGINDSEIPDFISFAARNRLILRFIEFMKVSPLWQEQFFMPVEEVMGRCEKIGALTNLGWSGSGPARYYKIKDNVVGFIRTSEENCARCGRLRLSATGELKTCLYQPLGLSLREALRQNRDDDKIALQIRRLISVKDEVTYRRWEHSKIYMSSLGG